MSLEVIGATTVHSTGVIQTSETLSIQIDGMNIFRARFWDSTYRFVTP